MIVIMMRSDPPYSIFRHVCGGKSPLIPADLRLADRYWNIGSGTSGKLYLRIYYILWRGYSHWLLAEGGT